MRYLALVLLLFAMAPAPRADRFLVTWAMESNGTTNMGDGSGHDFLAVYEIDEAHFGTLVAMLPVPARARMAHHANYALPANRILFANDFMQGQSYVFDLSHPREPRISASFTDARAYAYPHSFAALSNGNTLATYQQRGHGDTAAGALVELDRNGRVIRASAAADAEADHFIRPYSVLALENIDRVVTTSADMMPSPYASHVVQVWRLSDLKLLKSVVLPKPKSFHGVAAEDPDEARVLSDGKTVLVKTGRCGIFRMNGLNGTKPSATFVYDFGYRSCSSVPVVIGRYWLQASLSGHTITALDVSDPLHPIQAGYLNFGPTAYPHWIAREPGTNRFVITGFGSLLNRITFAEIDPSSGALRLDPKSITLNKPTWPDGWKGRAIPHATLFY